MKRIFYLFFFSHLVLLSAAQDVLCNGDAYYFVAKPNSNSSDFYRIKLGATPTVELVRTGIPHSITATAYRFIDQRIYALDANTYELLQIDAEGNVQVLGLPEALNTALLYTAGAIHPSGRHLVVIGKDKQSLEDELIHTIQLYNDRHYAGVNSIVNDFNASVDDICLDPLRGTAYGFDRSTRKLVSLRLSDGFITNFFAQTQSGVGRIGSIFFDSAGELYGIGGSGTTSDNTLYYINKLNGIITPLEANIPSGGLTDACACPYSVQIAQEVQPAIIAPCEAFTIRYDLINHTASARSGTTFVDSLPSNFSIIEIVEKPFSGTSSGVGTNVFKLERADLLLDTNTIILRVEADEFAEGQYLSNWDLSGTINHIPISEQQAAWEVRTTKLLELDNHLDLKCETGELYLSPTLENAHYQWNTGDTTRILPITQTGTYSVTATLTCARAIDSINITTIPKPLRFSLTAPTQAQAGRTFSLGIESNNTIAHYSWKASPSTGFSCTDCPNPRVAPVQNTVFTLYAEDQYGCTAIDSIAIQVPFERDIYAPTAFSPNGDGINDLFYLQGISGIAEVVNLQVFDRWGNIVFEQKNSIINEQTTAWDGTVKSALAPTDVYFWTAQVHFVDGVAEQGAGVVQLLR